MMALLLAVNVLGSSVAMAQEPKKTEKKEIKAEKKMMKHKHHKALKKADKMEEKADMGK